MSRASSKDSRLSASEGERVRGDRRAAEVGWGAPVYPAAGPRGVKRPRSTSPPPVAVDEHRHLPARSRRTSASAQATSPLHASGRRRSWVHRRGTSYAAIQDSESTENSVAQGPVTIVLEPAPVDFDAKEVRTGARKSGRGKEREAPSHSCGGSSHSRGRSSHSRGPSHGTPSSSAQPSSAAGTHLLHPGAYPRPGVYPQPGAYPHHGIYSNAPNQYSASDLHTRADHRGHRHPARHASPITQAPSRVPRETIEALRQTQQATREALQAAELSAPHPRGQPQPRTQMQPAARAAYAHQLQPAQRGHLSRPTTREGVAGPSSGPMTHDGHDHQPAVHDSRPSPYASHPSHHASHPSHHALHPSHHALHPSSREASHPSSREVSHPTTRHRLPAREQGLRLAPETPPPVPPPVSTRPAGDERVSRLAGDERVSRLAGDERVPRLARDEPPLARFVVDESVLAAGGRVGAGVHVTSSRQPAAAGGKPVSASGKPMSASGKPMSASGKPVSKGRKPASTSGKHVSRAEPSGRPVSSSSRPTSSYGPPSQTGPGGQYHLSNRPPSSDMPLAPSRLAPPTQLLASTSPGVQSVSTHQNGTHAPSDAWPSHPGYSQWPDAEQASRPLQNDGNSRPPAYRPQEAQHPQAYYPPPPPQHVPPPLYPYDYGTYGPPRHDDRQLHAAGYDADPRPPHPAHPAAFRGVHRAEDFRGYAQATSPSDAPSSLPQSGSASSAPRINDAPHFDDHVAPADDAKPLASDEAASPIHPQSSLMDRKAADFLAALRREREARQRSELSRSPPRAADGAERDRPAAAHEQQWASDHARRESVGRLQEATSRRQEATMRRQEGAAREREDQRQAEEMEQRYPYHDAQQHLDEGGRRPEMSALVPPSQDVPSTRGCPPTSDAPARAKPALRQPTAQRSRSQNQRDHQRVLENEEKRRRKAEAKAEKQREVAEMQRLMKEYMAQHSDAERQQLIIKQQQAQAAERLRQTQKRGQRWWNGVPLPAPAGGPPDLESALAGANVLTYRLWTGGPDVPAPPESAPWLQTASEVQFMVVAEEEREQPTGTIEAQREAETEERDSSAEAEATAAPPPTRAASPSCDAPLNEPHPAGSQPAEPCLVDTKTLTPYWFHPNVGWTFEPPALNFLDPPCENETLFRPSHTPVPALEPASWDAPTASDIVPHESDMAGDAATSTAEHHDPVAPSYPSAGHGFPPTDHAATSRLPGALNPGMHGEAPQDDLVQTLVLVSQRAYVIPREYSVEHDYSARLAPCPVCEGRDESDDEGNSLPPSCVHEKVLAECERCKELGLVEGARWKTQCIAQEGVPRHQVWSRLTSSEGVRAQALAAYADEYSDEEEENELRYPDDEPAKQDVGVEASIASQVEDPQTVRPMEDSDSDDDIQITGYNPAPVPPAGEPATWSSPSAIANRYLPTDYVLTLRDGVLIPVPRASVTKDTQIVESLPITHTPERRHVDAATSTQAEVLDDEARNLKRLREGDDDESPRPSKLARSASPPSGPTEDDDAAAAQALVLLLNGNGQTMNHIQPEVDESSTSAPSSLIPEAPSSSTSEAPASEVSSPSADTSAPQEYVDAPVTSSNNIPKATEEAAAASPGPVGPPPEVFMDVDGSAAPVEAGESTTPSKSLRRSSEEQHGVEGHPDDASGEVVHESATEELGESSLELDDGPSSVIQAADVLADDEPEVVDQAQDAQLVVDAEVVAAADAHPDGVEAPVTPHQPLAGEGHSPANEALQVDGEAQADSTMRAATPSTVVEDGEIVEKDVATSSSAESLSSAIAIEEVRAAVAVGATMAIVREEPADIVEECPAGLARADSEVLESEATRLSVEADESTPCRPLSSAADVAAALFPPSPEADVTPEPTRLSSEAAVAAALFPEEYPDVADLAPRADEPSSSTLAALTLLRVSSPLPLRASCPPPVHVSSFPPSLHVSPPSLSSAATQSPVSPDMPMSAIAITPMDDRVSHVAAICAAGSKAVDAADSRDRYQEAEASTSCAARALAPSYPVGAEPPSVQDFIPPSVEVEHAPPQDIPPPQPSGFAGTLENGYARAFAAGCPPNDRQLVKQGGMIMPAGQLQPPRARLSFKEHLALKRKREAAAAADVAAQRKNSWADEETHRESKRARIEPQPPTIPAALMTKGGSRPRFTKSPPASQKATVEPASDRTSPSHRDSSNQDIVGTSTAYRNVMGSFCM